MRRMIWLMVSLVLCACGLEARSLDESEGNDGASEVAQAIVCEDPPRACDEAVPLGGLLSDDEIRNMPSAGWFRPPVIDGEDNIIGWRMVTENGELVEKREEFASDYSLTFGYAADPDRDSWLLLLLRLRASDGSPWTAIGDCSMGDGLVLVD